MGAGKKVLITGAAGGMGRACASLIGLTHDLVLNDVNAPALATFAEELARDAFTVTGTVAGDTCDDSVLASITALLSKDQPFAVVHTAGVSPSLGDWQTIMRVNMLGTVKLLEALQPHVCPGTAAVLISSSAAHIFPAMPEAEAVMQDALNGDLVARMQPFIEQFTARSGPDMAGGIAYSFSKRGVLTYTKRKAIDWGPLGGRVVSISPGLMLTPMGRKELEAGRGAQQMLDAAPLGRPGTAMDIALAVQFALSPEASFITGSDILVDGGSVAAMQLSAQQ